ncbi:MAG: hypothetical protein SF097_02525 [Acidobacteriota bacterium]|nr:hypothetical protein [Acidobacteriota bacterium]
MEQVITIGELAEMLNTEEVLKQNGVSLDDKVEVKIANRTMTVRSLNDEERARKISALTREIFDEHREVFVELAKGHQ